MKDIQRANAERLVSALEYYARVDYTSRLTAVADGLGYVSVDTLKADIKDLYDLLQGLPDASER